MRHWNKEISKYLSHSEITYTIKIIEGIGVKHFILISEMAAGRCPFLAPTKNSRELAKIAPLSDPKVEKATNSGINQANMPSILSPNVTATAKDA